MGRLEALTLLLAVVVGAAALVGNVAFRGHVHAAGGSSAASGAALLPVSNETPSNGERGEPLRLKPGSKHEVAEFEIGRARTLRLSTAEAVDGRSCLVEEDSRAGLTAGCEDNGLFGLRKVAFSVHTDGGPDTFDELQVVGLVAPNVRGLDVVTADGEAARILPSSEGAFLYKSTKAQLEAHDYPTVIRLYGPSGRLLDTVTFPPAG